MKKINTLLAASMLMLGAACQSTNNNAAATSIDGEWKVTTLNGQEVPETMKEPTLSFNEAEQTYNGVTGINSISGNYTQENGSVSFSDGPMTKMAADSVSMEVENSYVKALLTAKTLTEEDGTLLLKDENGNTLMSLTRK